MAHTYAKFPTTRWTLVESLRHGEHDERESALQSLTNIYWPPVYAFIRRSGKDSEEAADLAQAFFLETVLKRRLFEHAQSDKGRLRSLILVSLKNFLIDNQRSARANLNTLRIHSNQVLAEERGFHHNFLDDPETAFQRRWAVAVVEEALKRCEQQYIKTGKLARWKAFEARIIRPSCGMTAPPPYEVIAEQLALSGDDEAYGHVRDVRKRFLVVLQQVVAETVEDIGEQKAEYDEVLSLLM